MVLHSAKDIFPLAFMSSFLSFLQYSSQIMPNSPSSPDPPSPAFLYMSPNDPHLHNTSSPVPRLTVLSCCWSQGYSALSSLPCSAFLFSCSLLGAAQGAACDCGCTGAPGSEAPQVGMPLTSLRLRSTCPSYLTALQQNMAQSRTVKLICLTMGIPCSWGALAYVSGFQPLLQRKLPGFCSTNDNSTKARCSLCSLVPWSPEQSGIPSTSL